MGATRLPRAPGARACRLGPASGRLVPCPLACSAGRLTGVWFQTVGAQWLLVSHPHASILVSLVQVATTLPYVLFGLVAGVLADTLDRRLFLIAVQVTVAASARCWPRSRSPT